MDIPFKVEFVQYKRYKDTIRKKEQKLVEFFVGSIQELFELKDEDIVHVTEYLDLEVIFSGPENARFYMDGLDTLPEHSVKEDIREDVYISPSSHQTIIYKNGENTEYYPLIPGYYRIKVVIGEQPFYSLLKVMPKQMNQEQWEFMRDEIEQILHGLAQDLIRQNSNVMFAEDIPIPVSQMRKWLLLQNYKAKLLNALEQLIKSPRSEINKTYRMTPASLAKRTDEKTIRYASQHPELTNVLKEQRNYLSYNLPENRWLRHIIKTLATVTNELFLFLNAYKISVERDIQNYEKWSEKAIARTRTLKKALNRIDIMINDSRNFLSMWNKFLNIPWLQEVKEGLPLNIPMALTFDSRYRIFYKVYRELQGEQYSVSLDPSYSYHWKRTDLLYEIWGYLQIVNIFSKTWSGTKGWIFDLNLEQQQIKVPNLDEGTCIEFKKDGIKIRIVYDEKLKSQQKDTDLNHPLYTSSQHNKPDCRIDVYDSEGHIGSLLIDFKCRPKQSIWDRVKIKTQQQTKTMKQIEAYTHCRSHWFFKDRAPDLMMKIFSKGPVHEVWAVFPKKNEEILNREKDDYNVRLVDLTPSVENNHFAELLEKVIQEMKDTADLIKAYQK